MIGLRYQERNSAFHKLNPLSKVAWGSGILLLSVVFNHPLYILLLFLVIITVIISTRIGREWVSVMKFALYLCTSIVVINALVSYHGSHILVEAPFRLPVMGTPIITVEAIFFGLVMSLRLVVIVSVFTLLTLTTHPDDFMKVLLKLKIPYKSVLVTSLSTRFVPCLLDDSQRISDVHKSRGLELDKGNWLKRVKNRTRIIIPLLSNSLDRAAQVAEAMESRAFGITTGRTFYKELRMTCMDLVILVLGILACILGITMRLFGYGDYQFYPTSEAISPSSVEWLMLLPMVLLLISILPLAHVKKVVDLD